MMSRFSYLLLTSLTIICISIFGWINHSFFGAVGSWDRLSVEPPNNCLTFLHYEPSDLELDWQKHALLFSDASSSVCSYVFNNPKGSHFVSPLMDYLKVALAMDSDILAHSSPYWGHQSMMEGAAVSSISRMVYREECGRARGTRVVSHLPPLAAILRDPRGICPLEQIRPVLNKYAVREASKNDQFAALIVDAPFVSHAAGLLRQDRGARAVLFDCGASQFGMGKAANNPGIDGTLWLYERYAALGMIFDDIFGWEPSTPSDVFFKAMPANLVAKTRYFPFGISSEVNAISNPLTILKNFARRGDFVVFKLDIDTPQIENAIVEQLLNDPEALALIDDFYYEHHFKILDMVPWWGVPEHIGGLKASTDLFRRLRESGLRAQVWP